jgi:hypothetical protein
MSEDIAQTVSSTFASITPELPVSVMGPKEVADATVKLESESSTEDVKLKKRAELSRRNTFLLDRQVVEGWFDFGQIVKQEIVPLGYTEGLQIQLTNYRKQTLKCNIKNAYGWKKLNSLLAIMTNLQKAQLIAEAQGKTVYLMTSAHSKYRIDQWFDTIWVKFKDVK